MSPQTLPRLLAAYRDPDYIRPLLRIAGPVALQSLLNSGLNMVSVMMIGQKGEVSVAAVALAGQVFFLLNLVLFGLSSGAAMFTAQLWGKQDVHNIRRVLGLTLALSAAVAALFWGVSVLMPQHILAIYTQDKAVIRLGSDYLRLFAWSFPFFIVTFAFSSILRSMGNVRLPVAVSTSVLALNGVLTYLLLFGVFGWPGMGVLGAAWAIIISRVLETVVLIALIYLRRSPLASHPRDLLDFDLGFAVRILKPVLPVAVTEILWSLAITTYNAIYGRMGTESIAAMNIAGTLDQMALVIFFGLTHGTAVLVGNTIGAGNREKAIAYARRSIGLAAAAGILMGGMLYGVSGLALTLYKVSPQVIVNAKNVLGFVSLFFSIRVMNMMMLIGIFRSGGDTNYAMFLDGIIIWLVGVPLSLLGGMVLGWPVQWVYLMTMMDELTKWVLSLYRFFSGKWIHDLTRHV
ncbi:MAG: MATE family efflux transporter [Anaerolineales bacterium]